MTIKELVERSYRNALNKGFYDNGENNIAERLALIHSEVSEALESYRETVELGIRFTASNGKPDGFVVELADAVIRIADLCGRYELDLQQAIELKMNYNATREHKHGKRF